MDDKRIRQIAEGTYARGDATNLVRHLCKQLLAERELSKTLMDRMIQLRHRTIELERHAKTQGRVLIVDAPPPRDDMKLLNGELVVFYDPLIEFRYVSLPVPYASNDFDEALAAELKGQFRDMPWELSSRYETVWSRWIA